MTFKSCLFLVWLSWASCQCNTNIKFWTKYEYEYIRNGKFQQIRISNIFVFCKLVKYEYRIYLFLANWSNTNIEYIRV